MINTIFTIHPHRACAACHRVGIRCYRRLSADGGFVPSHLHCPACRRDFPL